MTPLTRSMVHGVSLVVLCFCLVGCPYQSEVPLDSPTTPIDSHLLGTWQEESSDNSAVYTVQADGDFEYSIHSVGNSGTDQFHGYLTQIGKQWFLNLSNDDQSFGGRYSLFRIELAADGASFQLYPVTENITERFSQSSDLRNFVEQNQDLSFFYEKPSRYVHPASVANEKLDQANPEP